MGDKKGGISLLSFQRSHVKSPLQSSAKMSKCTIAKLSNLGSLHARGLQIHLLRFICHNSVGSMH